MFVSGSLFPFLELPHFPREERSPGWLAFLSFLLPAQGHWAWGQGSSAPWDAVGHHAHPCPVGKPTGRADPQTGEAQAQRENTDMQPMCSGRPLEPLPGRSVTVPAHMQAHKYTHRPTHTHGNALDVVYLHFEIFPGLPRPQQALCFTPAAVFSYFLQRGTG